MIQNFDELLKAAGALATRKVGVVFPNNDGTFLAISEATSRLGASFVLFGPWDLIEGGLSNVPRIRNSVEVAECATIEAALSAALLAASNGEVNILMKGGVDTSTMMKVILSNGGQPLNHPSLRTGRLISDIFVFEYPKRSENKFVMITDGGMTLSPDLKKKVELIRNAVEVAHALGNMNPKVAVLSATEFVLPDLQSTVDAAALSKMNERGQIKGCIVDGPLALDNALSVEAAAEKGIRSEVAGKAEILVASNIEAANSLAKSTTYFAEMRLAHVIVGAKIPILIPSRSDRSDAKLLSIALGSVVSEYLKEA